MLRFFALSMFAVVSAATFAPAVPAADESKSGYRTIGDYTSVYGFQRLRVEAIGLVVGLPKTGGDPPPGIYRDEVLTLMRQNEVENPERLLASKSVAAVLLRGSVPPGARKSDMVDVEVMVLPNDNETTSLRGGYLLPVKLGEKLAVGPGLKRGKDYITVDGPILVSEPKGKSDENAVKVGRILGKGKVLDDRDFIITIDRDSRSARLAKEIQFAINSRFFANEAGNQKGIANAKNKTEIHITVPPQYKNNVVRFLHVCRRVPVRLPDNARAALIKELRQDLMNPAKSYEAALRLEALGLIGVTPLKDAIDSEAQIVRFSAAEALAYLGDARGLKELSNLAEADSLYRPYAIAALASPRLPQSTLMLTRLLNSPGAETRYGAFRALWLINKNDPIIMGEALADDCTLHQVHSTSEPMVHVASRFRPEIVIFGKGQKLAPPVLLRVGDHLIVQHEGQGEKLLVAYFTPGKQPVREESTLEVADLLRKAAKVGAKYPDLVELLRQASASGCLQSRLEINALPKAASFAEIANGDRNDVQQLPTGLPSMFHEEDVKEEPKKRPPETAKKEETKKPWWKFWAN